MTQSALWRVATCAAQPGLRRGHVLPLLQPETAGKHTMTICTRTACYIKGTDKLVAAAEARLGIPQGQTTKDGKISLMTARCVGACGRAPVVLTDGELQGQMSSEHMLEQLERWAVE